METTFRLEVTGSAVKRIAGRLREDHPLHDHGHLDLAVVEAVAQPVGHGPLGEQGGPAAADVREDRGRPHDVQVGVLLAGEGGRRQVLRRRAGPDGVGRLPAKPGDRAGDRRRQIAGDGDPLNGPADLRTERADRLPVVGVQAATAGRAARRSRRAAVMIRRKASVVTQKPRRHANAFDPGELPQVRALAPNERDLRLVDLVEARPDTGRSPQYLQKTNPVVRTDRSDCPRRSLNLVDTGGPQSHSVNARLSGQVPSGSSPSCLEWRREVDCLLRGIRRLAVGRRRLGRASVSASSMVRVRPTASCAAYWSSWAGTPKPAHGCGLLPG